MKRVGFYIIALSALTASANAQITIPTKPPAGLLTHSSVETEVAGAAMSVSGRAYMWYRDGTVTAGSPEELDDWRTPYEFETARGKTPENIVAMAISSKDRVYTWYDDNTRSVGTSSDLDAYEAPKPYALPYKPNSRQKYQPQDIVDIAISAHDTVYTYFQNGMSARGASTNLGASSSNIPYTISKNRAPHSILGVAMAKSALPTSHVWFNDGRRSAGNPNVLGATSGLPFSQHLTLYSFKPGAPFSDPGFWTPNGAGDFHTLREDLGAVHEPVIAPGMTNIAIARGALTVFAKTGEMLFRENPSSFFSSYLNGTNDPVLNLNTWSGLGDCQNGYEETEEGHGFCIFQAYDTRAAFDKKGGRFVFLANARNYVWQGKNLDKAPDDECSRYIAPPAPGEEDGESVFSDQYCDKGRRNLIIGVSVSENPLDGFHLYGVKENNYRDWPLLTVRGDQLIVGHNGGENPAGYAAIVFNLQDMRNGDRRPQYFKLHKEDLHGAQQIRFPRRQETNAPLTIGVASNGHVYGFSRFADGYEKPSMRKSPQIIPSSVNYTLSHGALRIASSVGGSGHWAEGVKSIHYGRYPISITLLGINIATSWSAGAQPLGPITMSDPKYRSLNCARLAVTGAGGEAIGFAAAVKPTSNATKVKYSAAFMQRPHDATSFSGPIAYQNGGQADPDSQIVSYITFYHEDMCQQQGGAEADPANPHRVWMMHNFGMQNGNLNGALGWVDIY